MDNTAKWLYNEKPKVSGLYLVQDLNSFTYHHFYFDTYNNTWATGLQKPKEPYRFLNVPIDIETLKVRSNSHESR